MQIKNYIASITLLAGIALSSVCAHAQAISVRVGGVGGAIGGLGSLGSGVGSLASVGVGSLGATALGGGSLANVAIGSTNATILPLASGSGTSPLTGGGFFLANQSKNVAGFGSDLALVNPGSGGGGTQFGVNGSVEAPAAKKRLVTTERTRKLKRRMVQISAAN